MRPADLRFSMPAEWAPHVGCWMGWPRRLELWEEHLEAARADYLKVAHAIGRFEPVTLLADPQDVTEVRRRCGDTIKVVSLPLDDSWLRDSGPTILVGAGGSARRGRFDLQPSLAAIQNRAMTDGNKQAQSPFSGSVGGLSPDERLRCATSTAA